MSKLPPSTGTELVTQSKPIWAHIVPGKPTSYGDGEIRNVVGSNDEFVVYTIQRENKNPRGWSLLLPARVQDAVRDPNLDVTVGIRWETESPFKFGDHHLAVFEEFERRSDVVTSMPQRMRPRLAESLASALYLGLLAVQRSQQPGTVDVSATFARFDALVATEYTNTFRMQYVLFCIAFFIIISALCIWQYHAALDYPMVNADNFKVIAYGSLGALLAGLTRYRTLDEAAAPEWEMTAASAAVRLIRGGFYGVVIGLAWRSGIIESLVNFPDGTPVYFLAVVAGYSDIFVPEMLQQVNGRAKAAAT